uniref:Uncharacterized protein n=1 Tax=Ascaris lumbricoides TaxID=6252 RepID=A0A0M3HM05_ASCLU
MVGCYVHEKLCSIIVLFERRILSSYASQRSTIVPQDAHQGSIEKQ